MQSVAVTCYSRANNSNSVLVKYAATADCQMQIQAAEMFTCNTDYFSSKQLLMFGFRLHSSATVDSQ